MEFYIHVNTFWEVFQSFSRNIFLFTGNVTLVRIMLPYSICSTVDFPFSEEGIFRSDFNQRRTDIFPALPLINRSLRSPSQRDLHPQLPGSSPLRQQNALSQGQRSSCRERWSVPSWRNMRSVSSLQVLLSPRSQMRREAFPLRRVRLGYGCLFRYPGRASHPFPHLSA